MSSPLCSQRGDRPAFRSLPDLRSFSIVDGEVDSAGWGDFGMHFELEIKTDL